VKRLNLLDGHVPYLKLQMTVIFHNQILNVVEHFIVETITFAFLLFALTSFCLGIQRLCLSTNKLLCLSTNKLLCLSTNKLLSSLSVNKQTVIFVFVMDFLEVVES